MEKQIRLKAPAKLNLMLNVLDRRPDGYHTLDTLMVSADLYDDVVIEKSREVFVTFTDRCGCPPVPYRNTVRSAAELYRSLTGRGAHIRVVKRIPQEAGLGGGSADAAAVLSGLNALYRELDESTLYALAKRVGADVPYCLHGGFCRAGGIGEILTPLTMKAPLHLVIAKPKAGVSTGQLFRSLSLPCEKGDMNAAIAALTGEHPISAGEFLFNALQKPAEALCPEIGALISLLKEQGAAGACMTGSGSAVFALFETPEQAEAASEAVKAARPDAFAVAASTV